MYDCTLIPLSHFSGSVTSQSMVLEIQISIGFVEKREVILIT